MIEEWKQIALKIRKICADLEVFISYTSDDLKVAKVLKNV